MEIVTLKRNMKYQTRRVSAVAGTVALLFNLNPAVAAVVTFESVPLPAIGYQNGSNAADDFMIGGAAFTNTYNPLYGSWTGFAISNHTDALTPGYLNQYSSITGSGAGGSAQYAVGYYTTYETSTNISLGGLTDLAGLGSSISNTTYAALALRDGDSGVKKFGGDTGTDPDWFLLTIEGYAGGLQTGETIEFYLADYRSADSASDYWVNDWRFVDFSPLGSVDEIRFSMSSSDTGIYGMNTPSYFAMDNFLAVPEPSSLLAAGCSLGLILRRRR